MHTFVHPYPGAGHFRPLLDLATAAGLSPVLHLLLHANKPPPPLFPKHHLPDA